MQWACECVRMFLSCVRAFVRMYAYVCMYVVLLLLVTACVLLRAIESQFFAFLSVSDTHTHCVKYN